MSADRSENDPPAPVSNTQPAPATSQQPAPAANQPAGDNAAWEADVDVPRLERKLKDLGPSGDDARKELFPEREKIPVEEWKARARKRISEIEGS